MAASLFLLAAVPSLLSVSPCTMIAALNARLAADRVDRLRPEEQLTLKVASVLGLTVYSQLLQVHIREIHICMVGFASLGLLQAQSGWLVLAAKNEETACPTNCSHAPSLAAPSLPCRLPTHNTRPLRQWTPACAAWRPPAFCGRTLKSPPPGASASCWHGMWSTR